MQIDLQQITIEDIAKNYKNDNEDGVSGYNDLLNIRPKYQREFVYKDKQRDLVIQTIKKGLPLNVMYWAKNTDGSFEVLDGQQRTISFCSYISGDFSIDHQFFHNLTQDEKDEILKYKLMVYVCEGTDKEKLDWFRIINIAGEKLTEQELRNAVYTGTWLTDAKKYFSKTGGPAYDLAKEYINGSPIRQDYLETAIQWIADQNNETIEDYMAKHQHDNDANELWVHFQQTINWIKLLFPDYRREMKGLAWGSLYNTYKNTTYNTNTLKEQVKNLMIDEDVTKKSGVYSYLISNNEKHLNIRAFTDSMRREAFERQDGLCPACGDKFEITEMEADHIEPWHVGGKTIAQNCQMLCKACNRQKSGK